MLCTRADPIFHAGWIFFFTLVKSLQWLSTLLSSFVKCVSEVHPRLRTHTHTHTHTASHANTEVTHRHATTRNHTTQTCENKIMHRQNPKSGSGFLGPPSKKLSALCKDFLATKNTCLGCGRLQQALQQALTQSTAHQDVFVTRTKTRN